MNIFNFNKVLRLQKKLHKELIQNWQTQESIFKEINLMNHYDSRITNLSTKHRWEEKSIKSNSGVTIGLKRTCIICDQVEIADFTADRLGSGWRVQKRTTKNNGELA